MPASDPRQHFRAALEKELRATRRARPSRDHAGVTADARLKQARQELVDACDGFFAREAIAASLTPDERREILRGMVLTRAVDNRLKQFFTSGEVAYQGVPVPGQGLPVARPGSDLRRRHPAAPRPGLARIATATGRATSSAR